MQGSKPLPKKKGVNSLEIAAIPNAIAVETANTDSTDIVNNLFASSRLFSAIKAENSYDPAHYSYKEFKPALYVDGSITAELISNANQQAEYFDVEVAKDGFKLTPKSGATVPTATVVSTLVVKAKCAYGHEMTIMQLPVNITQK